MSTKRYKIWKFDTKAFVSPIPVTQPNLNDRDSLNREHIEASLLQFNSLPGRDKKTKMSWHLHLFEQVDSTNQTLWQLIQQGTPEGTVAIATRQHQGKGQRGRQWLSDTGGLYLSVALYPNILASQHSLLTLSTAWGIATRLRQWAVPVQVKWPNDLILDGRKLGGILIETRIRGDRIVQAVVGVGINWNNPVPDSGIALLEFLQGMRSPLVHSPLRDIGNSQTDKVFKPPRSNTPSSINRLAAQVLLGLEDGITKWRQEGFEAIATSYNTVLLTHQGERVNVPTASNSGRWGRVMGIDSVGNLNVLLEENTSTISPQKAFPPGTIRLGYGQPEGHTE